MVGVGNLLPIPGLDGSYPFLILLEKIIIKNRAIPLINKIVKYSVRIILILNIIFLPWFLLEGIKLLDWTIKSFFIL
jgi:membrane-associated protease RseP (regulator of RpoE activity)